MLKRILVGLDRRIRRSIRYYSRYIVNVDLNGRIRNKTTDIQFGTSVVISGEYNLTIGGNVHIGSNSFLRCEGGLIIGDNVIISRNLMLYTLSHNHEGKRLPFDETYRERPVIIEKNVWIGTNVLITPGTKIGEGSVIGMGCVLHGDIPKRSIVVNDSQRVIAFRNEEHYDRLKQISSYAQAEGEYYAKD